MTEGRLAVKSPGGPSAAASGQPRLHFGRRPDDVVSVGAAVDGRRQRGPRPAEEAVAVVDCVLVLRHALPVQTHLYKKQAVVCTCTNVYAQYITCMYVKGNQKILCFEMLDTYMVFKQSIDYILIT